MGVQEQPPSAPEQRVTHPVRATAGAPCSRRPRGCPQSPRARPFWAGSLQRCTRRTHVPTPTCARSRTDRTHTRAHAYEPRWVPAPVTEEPLGTRSLCCPGPCPFPQRGGGQNPGQPAPSQRSAAAPPACPARWRPPALLKIIYGSNEHICLKSAAEFIPSNTYSAIIGHRKSAEERVINT